jgi:hypothetical protein
MTTIVVIAAIAGVVYIIYKNLPAEQRAYDAVAKEENLIATEITTVVEDVKKEV